MGNEAIRPTGLLHLDVAQDRSAAPDIALSPPETSIVLISEASLGGPGDFCHAAGIHCSPGTGFRHPATPAPMSRRLACSWRKDQLCILAEDVTAALALTQGCFLR